MRECECEAPVESDNPRRSGTCVKCAHRLSPRWSPNDETVRDFLDRLSEAYPATPAWFERFRGLCEARERHGRVHFGYAYLDRDNVAEGAEEAADGVLYALLDTLRAKREGEDENIDLALTAAWHFAEAYQTLLCLRAKRGGDPDPIASFKADE